MSVNRPADLPEARAEMIDVIADPRAEKMLSEAWRGLSEMRTRRIKDATPEVVRQHFLSCLQVADLY